MPCSGPWRSAHIRPRGRCCTGCGPYWSDRELLSGAVEEDETFIGGEEPGLAGGRASGRARGKKALVCVAVEVKSPKGFGRCRMAIIEDATNKTLHKFIADHIEVGATVITDGWSGYQGIDKLGYFHDRRSQRAAAARGDDPGELARRTPHHGTDQTVAVEHSSRSSGPRALGRVFGRVRVPVQPPHLAEPWTNVHADPATRRQP